MLRGESLRSIAFDFNERGIKPAGGKRNGESKIDKWQGSTLRRVLMSPRIAGLREHNGEVVGEATWPAIIDRATHDRLVGLLEEPRAATSQLRQASRPPAGWSGPLRHLRREADHATSSRGRVVATAAARTRTSSARGAVRIVAEPLEAYVEGYVIDQWRNPRALKIAQSDDDRMERIGKISREMAQSAGAEERGAAG